MNVCRICLANESDKDIFDLKVHINGKMDSLINLMEFCFNIKITQSSKISTKLCLKCHKNILLFHEFKTLALQSETYLRSLDKELKEEKIDEDIKAVKDSIKLIHDEEYIEVKEVSGIKIEDSLNQSDDECLSILNTMKYEYVEEESKENAPVKKKRGTPKVLKPKVKSVSRGRVCEECGLTVKDLKSHMYQHQPVEMRKRYKCEVCGQAFSSSSARYKHNRIKHLGIKQHCKICDKYILHLPQHTLTVHNKEKLPFGCVSCDRRFISRSHRDRHVAMHTKDRPHACDLCDKKFAVNANLTIHKRQVHDKEKMHLCQYCSKSFFKKYHLHVHLRCHTKEKPFKCPDCSKCFATNETLKNHKLTHRAEKIFECSLCPMTFIRKGYLRAHMISHTKEKPHECQYCGVRFGRSDHRKRHEYTAHQRHLLPEPGKTRL